MDDNLVDKVLERPKKKMTPEEKKAYQRNYYLLNKAKLVEKHKKYNEEHKDKIKTWAKERYVNKRDELLAYQNEYNKKKKEKTLGDL